VTSIAKTPRDISATAALAEADAWQLQAGRWLNALVDPGEEIENSEHSAEADAFRQRLRLELQRALDLDQAGSASETRADLEWLCNQCEYWFARGNRRMACGLAENAANRQQAGANISLRKRPAVPVTTLEYIALWLLVRAAAILGRRQQPRYVLPGCGLPLGPWIVAKIGVRLALLKSELTLMIRKIASAVHRKTRAWARWK
jgi:hypothetical protein